MYCVVLIAITVHYSSFKPSFDFNDVIGVEDMREERAEIVMETVHSDSSRHTRARKFKGIIR